ncbi:hypothetical protein YC2023_033541 [Brassica napus]
MINKFESVLVVDEKKYNVSYENRFLLKGKVKTKQRSPAMHHKEHVEKVSQNDTSANVLRQKIISPSRRSAHTADVKGKWICYEDNDVPIQLTYQDDSPTIRNYRLLLIGKILNLRK